MKTIEYIGWLAEQALGGLRYLWPVTLVLGVLCAVGFIFTAMRHPEELRRGIKFLVMPLLGTALTLLVGAVFENTPKLYFVPYVAVSLVVLLEAFAIYKTKRIWPVSSATAALVLWASSWCWFVAVMSVTGDWM